MSDWHFGMDYDMWLYPKVDWTSPDYNYELPEPILAANIEGTMLINAEDAIEQVRILQAENAKLRELVRDAWGDGHPDKSCGDCEIMDECHAEIEEARKNGNGRWNTHCLFERRIEDRMRELGVEVKE